MCFHSNGELSRARGGTSVSASQTENKELRMDQGSAERILGSVRIVGVEEMYERDLTAKLALCLGAESRVLYPGCSSSHCDLVLPTSDGKGDWIECRCSWTYSSDAEPGTPNPKYRQHLLGADGSSVLRDLKHRLPRLVGSEEVRGLGLMLVCFDSEQQPMPEAEYR